MSNTMFFDMLDRFEYALKLQENDYEKNSVKTSDGKRKDG